MHAGDFVFTTLAMFGLSGGQLILILGAIVILYGRRFLLKLLPPMHSGSGKFRRTTVEREQWIEAAAKDAGRSLGGIYGKPAVEAITPGNQIAELYEPAALGVRNTRRGRGTRSRWFRNLFATERGRWILATMAALVAAGLAIFALHPLIASAAEGAPEIVRALDALVGVVAILLVASLAQRIIPRS